MTATVLLIYSLISGALLSLLWAVFRLAGINRLTCHSLNRLLLVSILAVSVIMPVVAFIGHTESAPAAAVEIAPVIIDADGLTPAEFTAAEPTAPRLLEKLISFLPAIYVIGVAASALWLLVALLGVALAIIKGEKRRIDRYTTLVIHSSNITPFTWGRWIVISRSDLEANASMLLSHESAHKAAAHWLDLLLARLVVCVDWYWPTAWLLNRDLAAVHEYQADRRVLDGGSDATAYQMLLISKGTSGFLSNIANPFNYSSLKNRITMMQKKQSPARSRMRCLVMLPAAALAIFISAAPALASAVKSVLPAPAPAASEAPVLLPAIPAPVPVVEEKAPEKVTAPADTTVETYLRGVEKKADGTPKSLYVVDGTVTTYEKQKLIPKDKILLVRINHTSEAVEKYGEAAKDGAIEVITVDAPEELKAAAQATLAQSETLTAADAVSVRTRKASDANNAVTVLSSIDEAPAGGLYILDGKKLTADEVENLKNMDRNEIQAVRVVKGERAVGLFGPEAANGAVLIHTKAFVARQAELNQNAPTFPGGDKAMYRFLSMNIRYPAEAAQKNIQGKVIVQFRVQKDGSLTDAHVIDGVDPLLDAEAVRVINSMPKFNPATENGEPVAAWYTLPISFKLSDGSEASDAQFVVKGIGK